MRWVGKLRYQHWTRLDYEHTGCTDDEARDNELCERGRGGLDDGCDDLRTAKSVYCEDRLLSGTLRFRKQQASRRCLLDTPEILRGYTGSPRQGHVLRDHDITICIRSETYHSEDARQQHDLSPILVAKPPDNWQSYNGPDRLGSIDEA